MDFSTQVLQKSHQRESFDCGVDDLNRYLRTQARQDMDRGAAVIYVLVPSDQPTRIAGYYSLSATAVRLQDLPDSTRKKLPRYPLVPATLLGRLAVDHAFRGRRLGGFIAFPDQPLRLFIAMKTVEALGNKT